MWTVAAALLAVGACAKAEPKVSQQPNPPPATVPSRSAGESIPAPADLKSPPADAPVTPSGLRFRVLAAGTSHEHPEVQDQVEVHYVGWSSDGTMFDSAIGTARAQFTLASAMPAWAEALASMVPGEKRRLWVPPKLAFGEEPQGRTPPGPLVFDLQLMSITRRPRPLPAPADVAAPPPEAKRSASGISYRVLTRGEGKRHPRPTDVVEVHYTAWTSDGRMVDSTVVNGKSTTMRADAVGKAWSEALATMVPGERTRFWIPAALAGWKGTTPTVVYDIELVAIR
jgi:FKBP-type peptidyl-prolyl cis-trans isomerase